MQNPVFIVGPTGAGKSEIAVSLAGPLSAEIVSCDSMQVYKGMDIGTDKPADEYRKRVRHHLIDIISLNEEYNVGRYVEDAHRAIEDIQKRGKLPLVVGGTGLYVKALVDGLFAGPEKNKGIRNRLEEKINKEGIDTVYEELKRADPAAVTKIKPKDKRRIIRALEVYYITGRPISSFQRQWESKQTDCILIGLNRERKDLYDRIDKRVEQMFERGLVEETKTLAEQGLMRNKTAGQALGYKELLGYLEGRYTVEQAMDLLKQNTRRFAKRQLTWFRKDGRVKWFLVSEDEKTGEVVRRIAGFLGEKKV